MAYSACLGRPLMVSTCAALAHGLIQQFVSVHTMDGYGAEIGRAGESQPFDVVVTRGVIEVPSVRTRELDDGYWVIRVSRFQRDSGAEVTTALASALSEGEVRGIVLDR